MSSYYFVLGCGVGISVGIFVWELLNRRSWEELRKTAEKAIKMLETVLAENKSDKGRGNAA